MKIIKELKRIILEAGEILKLPIIEEEIKIEHPAEADFGDYSTNVAMALARLRQGYDGQAKSPRELAEKIKKEIEKENYKEFIKKIEVAGAGFINFYLNPEYLIHEAENINYELEFRNQLSEYGQGKTMVIDYSAPNIAKPFGIGHLRSTNIGQAIYNIYKVLGWRCVGDNHIGDWGTQYGKLVAAIKKWNTKRLDDLTIDDLEKLYVRFHKESESDEKLIDEGRDYFARLEKGDKETRDIWQKCVKISMEEFDRVYQMLGVQIDFVHGESFYEKKLDKIVNEIISKGITKESEGAVIVEFEGMPPAMLKKSNGTTTYFTRDMATVKYRLENWNPDLIVYEVGVDQELHFRQVFKAVEMMDWAKKCKLVHVAHGLIRWSTGKFSTRKGETIHLSEVIDKATEKAEEMAKKSVVDKSLTATEKEEMVKAVAIGAVKFNDLSSDPKRDIIFDWDKVMSLDGDSGPYLQYTFARCMSVLTKTQIREQKNIDEIPKHINKEEMALVREFYKAEEKILEAAERFSPAVIAEYLLGLARKYNEFYAKHRIIDQKEEDFRVFLTKTTATLIHDGLWLLGIKTIKKM